MISSSDPPIPKKKLIQKKSDKILLFSLYFRLTFDNVYKMQSKWTST